jgi:uncharacterized damage-inducible protein DinB
LHLDLFDWQGLIQEDSMAFYGARDLAESLRTVRKNTVRIAEDIPEGHYGFRPTRETRSVAQLLVHIALGPRFQQQIHQVERRTTLEGFDFAALVQQVTEEEQKPRSKAEIVEMLTRDGAAWASWIEGLSDDFLAERVAMPSGMVPSSKSRFEMLLSTKEHEMHHRGQLMLIERLIGVVPHLTREMQARMAHARQSQPAAG